MEDHGKRDWERLFEISDSYLNEWIIKVEFNNKIRSDKNNIRLHHLVFPIIMLIGLTLACKLPEEDKSISVDITPLAVLENPTNMQLPFSDRVSVGLYNHAVYDDVYPLKLVEIDVLMWRNSDSAEYRDLDCRGRHNNLIVSQESGTTRYYCETIAKEKMNEYTLGMGVWDSDIVVQKGDVFINIIDYGIETPDGKIEEETIEMIAMVWKRRIQDGTQNNFLPGEYYYEEWCARCHSIDGSTSTGSTFLNLYGSQIKLDNGETITADENYFRTSILEHQDAVVAERIEHLDYKERTPSAVSWYLEQGLNDIIYFITSLNSP